MATNVGDLAAELVEYFETGLRKARALFVATKDVVIEAADEATPAVAGAIVGDPEPVQDAPAAEVDGAEGRPTP